jgi:hypothetical protein
MLTYLKVNFPYQNMTDEEKEYQPPKEREKEKSSAEFERIEDIVQGRMRQVAEKYGMQYMPPSRDELDDKYQMTLAKHDEIYHYVDEKTGAIRMLSGYANGYNESGNHGLIVRKERETTENVTRVYRGGRFNANIPQVASLARANGIEVSDIHAYKNGKATMDKIIEKITDPEQKRSLQRDLKQTRERAERLKITEQEEVRRGHTDYTSGALAIDLYVSAALDPKDSYELGGNYNSAGGFVDKDGTIYAVMVIDVPDSAYENFGTEAGILGEIKPEWIRAVVPSVGTKETTLQNIKKAEKLADEINPDNQRKSNRLSGLLKRKNPN